MNYTIIPRHFIIKNGSIIPQNHTNQLNNNNIINFRNIPYIHTIRRLNQNKNQQNINELIFKIKQLQNEICKILEMSQSEKNILNESIINQQMIINEKNRQIQNLKKDIEGLSNQFQIFHSQHDKSKLESSMIVKDFFNKEESLSQSKISLQSSRTIYANVEDSRISQKLLKRVENSQNILDEMLKMIKKPLSKQANQTRIKTEINYQNLQAPHERLISQQNQFDQIFITNQIKKEQFLQHLIWESQQSMKKHESQQRLNIRQVEIFNEVLQKSKIIQNLRQSTINQKQYSQSQESYNKLEQNTLCSLKTQNLSNYK